MTNEAKVVLSGEDKLSAIFAKAGTSAKALGFSLDGIKTGAIAALGALAVPVSIGALASIAKASINAVDALNDVADATGASIENISALEDIAKRSGTGIDTVSTALVKFNAVLKDADPSKGPGAILKALGLSIEDLKRKDPAEAMRQVAVALNSVGDEGDRARITQELFGKSVKEVAPYLKDLADNGELVAKVTTQQAEEAEAFNKQLFRLQANASDAARSLLSDLVPALNKIIENMKLAKSYSAGFLDFLFMPGAANAAEKLKDYQSRLDGLLEDRKQYERAGSDTRGLDQAIATAARSVNYLKAVVNAEQLAKINFSAADQSDAEAYRLGIKRRVTLPASGGSGGGGGGGGRAAAQKDPYAEANRYLESLRKQLQTTEDLTVYEKLLADIRDGSIGKLNPKLQAQLEATAKQIDADKELSAITKQFAELSEQAAKAQEKLQEEAKGFYDATRTPIERLNIELARQDELLRKLGPAYKDTYMRAQEAAQDRYEAEVKVEEKITELDQFTQRAAQNMQDYLGSSFQQIMEGNFDNIGDAFVSMLNNMVAQAAAAQLSKYLFGDLLTGKSGGSNGVLGDFIGSAASSLFGGFRADGGDVQRGKGYIVGERGPEWFEPATSGTVVPNHALGGQTIQVSNVFHLSGPVDRRTQQQIGAAAAQGAQRALARNT